MDLTTYIITFEIPDLTRRNTFKQKLRDFSGYFCPINDSTWAIRADKKASEIRDALKQHLISSDRLFVIRTGTEAAWLNAYGQNNSDWLKKYL